MAGACGALELDLPLAPIDALHAMLEVQPYPAWTIWCEVQARWCCCRCLKDFRRVS